jgi:hypothetical protein
MIGAIEAEGFGRSQASAGQQADKRASTPWPWSASQPIGESRWDTILNRATAVGCRRAWSSPSDHQRKETTMSPLRARMIEDMTQAGLAKGTRKIYSQAVYRLAAHYRRAPDQLNEEEVRAYLLGLRQRGVARGTFQTSQYGLRFLYHHTLGRAWRLFWE